MKIFKYTFLLLTFNFAQQVTSYSWEDGNGTILGSYGNLSAPNNVGTTSGITPFDGSRMLTVAESPIDGTPQAFLAWITDLSPNQEIIACFYGYDDTPSSSPSLRIWGSWTSNSDINSYAGSADGNSAYTDGSGWSQVCHTFSTTQENWDTGEALVIQARLYSSSSGPDPTTYYIDLLNITAPNSATINYPGSASPGCNDNSACNYDPYATENDGSCIYPEGSISIYDIQYTNIQGEYCYESIHDQECWETAGIVTAISPSYPNFYIQDDNSDSYAGIYVHAFPSTLPSLGQEITITATVNEYYSLTQLIEGASFSVSSNGNNIEPTTISTADLANGCTEAGESLESMLVRINNITVTQSSNEFGEWYVNDGSGDVMINDKIFDGEWPDPSLGQEYASIIGVVDYSYSKFSILPRTMSDLELCPTCPVCDAGDDQLVLPSTVVTLDASGSYDPNGTIIAYEWTQISGSNSSLDDEEAVTTTFLSPDFPDLLTFRLTCYDNDFNESSDEITINVSANTGIQNIQCPTDLEEQNIGYCFDTPAVNDVVNISGFVTHKTPGDYPNFIIQQPGVNSCAGIFVYDAAIDPNIGDEINLTGTITEYNSLTQIRDITSFSIESYNNSINPLVINTGDLGTECSIEAEYLESMFIKIIDAEVEGFDGFGGVYVNDGTGSTLLDDYYFDGEWPNLAIGDKYTIQGIVGYYYDFKIYPRNINDFSTCTELGDLNGDNLFNVLDIVSLANCILAQNCIEESNIYGCAGDLNGDGLYNVLDIVNLANCVLSQNCGGRIDDSSEATLYIKNNKMYIESDGFIGGIQMTLAHDKKFEISMSDKALFSNYLTLDNKTRLIIVSPETDLLFNFSGNFEITEAIIANSQNQISIDLPIIGSNFNLHKAYPNPFNPITEFKFEQKIPSNVKINVYNSNGQIVTKLLNEDKPSGVYTLKWDASQFSSGIYFVKAEAANFTQSQKIMLIK